MDHNDSITTGAQLLSPTGKIWTVQGITPNGTRVVLTRTEPDGDHGAVVDVAAARRMVRIDQPATSDAADIELVEPTPPVLVRA